MTTPNEELLARANRLRHELGDSNSRLDRQCVTAMYEMEQALQSQAERIATQDAEIDTLRAELADMAVNTATYEHLVGLANDTATRLLKERDELRAELVDAELHTKQVERGLDKATAQLAEIEKTEPVAWINLAASSKMFRFLAPTEEDGTVVKDWQPLFTHPMPTNRLTELKLLMLTTAYEQGVGKGIQRRDCNPYAADTDEHAAWKLGYEEGLDKPMPAQGVEASMIKLPEPEITLAWCSWTEKWEARELKHCLAREEGDRVIGYTEAQLKQAVRDALDAQGVTELVEALEMIVSTHQGHCEHHVGVSKHSYNLADIAEEALSKYKGAKL